MLVDKEGYDTCTVNKSRNPRLNRAILKCDGDASKLKYMQETFSRQRADPHRMKYNKGQTYYFICKYYYHCCIRLSFPKIRGRQFFCVSATVDTYSNK